MSFKSYLRDYETYLKTSFIVIVIMAGLVCITDVYALDECLLEIDVSTACVMITPVLDCASYTYDIYHENGTQYVTDGAMTQIATTGSYNFTFSQAGAGAYLIVTCDNYTRRISVEGTTDITTIIANQVTISTKQSAVEASMYDNFTAINSSLSAEHGKIIRETDSQTNASIVNLNESLSGEHFTIPYLVGADMNQSHGAGNWSLGQGMTVEQNLTLYNISAEITEPFTLGSTRGLLNRIVFYILQELQGILW